MSTHELYLRPQYSAELNNNHVVPSPQTMKNLGNIAHRYLLGCSKPLAPALSIDSPLRESMNERQVNMYASGEPSAVSRAGWKFASLPVKNRMNNILPFTDVLLVDEEQQGHIHVSRAVLDALHENKSYLERFDATGEGVYFIDLVTVRGHKIGAPVCVE